MVPVSRHDDTGKGSVGKKTVMSKSKYFSLGCSLVFGLALGLSSLGAEEALPLRITREQAVELVIRENLTLQKSAIDLATQRRAAENRWAEVFPSISVSGSAGYSTSLSKPPPVPNDPSYSVQGSLSLQLNAGLPSLFKSTALAYQTGLSDFETAQKQLAIQVSKTFYSLITDEKNLDLLQLRLEAAENQAQKDEVGYKNGLVSDLNRQRSALAAASARLSLSQAETAYGSRLVEFLLSMGLEPDPGIKLEGAIEITRLELDPPRLIREHLALRSDVIKARQTIEKLELTAAQRNVSARAPSLSLSTSFRASPDTASGGISDSLSVSAGVSIPIDGWIANSKTGQTLSAAQADIDKARLDLTNTERTARQEMVSLALTLDNLWESIEIARSTVTLAELTYDSTEKGFNQGAVERLTLEAQRNTLAESRQQLLNAELQYLNATLDLAAAINVDINDLTQRRNEIKNEE
jgi:outer membrane protein TolC